MDPNVIYILSCVLCFVSGYLIGKLFGRKEGHQLATEPKSYIPKRRKKDRRV